MSEETKSSNKVTKPLSLSISSNRTAVSWTPFTLYIIIVQWDANTKWKVSRRFSDFDHFRKTFKEKSGNKIAKLPKTWLRNFEPGFIEKRQKNLQEFLNSLLQIPQIHKDPTFRAFLSCDEHLSGKSGAVLNANLTIEDFELLCVVGKGSYGKVMQVRKKDTGKIYAMKVLKKNELVKRKQVDHTITERKVLEHIDHPFIVSLRFAFQNKDKLYIVLDFFTGGELFFHLRNGRFKEARAKFYIAEIVMALECLHEHDIIYRDLKPENVLLDNDGHIRLTDFGLSKDDVQGDGLTHTFCGTPHYLAPEVIRGEGYGKVVDWWSLGTLLFELLTGLPPFYHKNLNKMYKRILRGKLQFPFYVTSPGQDIITRLLERDPTKRLGRNGAHAIKSHAFFNDIDWEKLYSKKVTPPFKPAVKSDGLTNFDQEFKRETPKDTPVMTAPLNKGIFPDFTYAGKDSSLGETADDSDEFSDTEFDLAKELKRTQIDSKSQK